MATHSCIGNPCWICYPQLKPRSLDGNYSNNLRIAIDEERERCAKIVDTWDISKGGYSELAYQIRNIKT
jgi:hypothetical protein